MQQGLPAGTTGSPLFCSSNWLRGPATPRKRHSLILPYRFELTRGVAADHEKQACSLSTGLHRQCGASERRGAPEEHLLSRGGCLWGTSPDCKTQRGTSHVSLPVRVHVQNRWYGERPRKRTSVDLFKLLRCALSSSPAEPVCRNARTENSRAPVRMLAGQHRLDRRAVRCW
jgi:hypothetical protein